MNDKELKHYENIALKEKDKPRLRHHALTKLCLIAEVRRLNEENEYRRLESKEVFDGNVKMSIELEQLEKENQRLNELADLPIVQTLKEHQHYKQALEAYSYYKPLRPSRGGQAFTTLDCGHDGSVGAPCCQKCAYALIDEALKGEE